ncbi:MAG: hypothetical protein KDB10_20650, partial [Acidimicrobiales bacterium]|nr:hypothetical protein [Acidimicrobiales bacterium]
MELVADAGLTPADPRLQRALRIISDSAVDLERVGTDLLDLERAAVGRLQVAPRPLDLTELAREAVAVTLGSARSASVPDGPVVARVDPTLTPRILESLLENADRHTPPACEIGVDVAVDGARVRLTVWDRGPGGARLGQG